MRNVPFAAGVGLAALCWLVVAGCSHSASKATEESNLKPLAVFYGRFISQHRGQAPANEAEFKAFVKSLSKAELDGFKITDPESIFVSSRDGKPYATHYGAASGAAGPSGSPVIAYEQAGKGGKRFVATTVGAVEEVDEARFKQLVPTAKAP